MPAADHGRGKLPMLLLCCLTAEQVSQCSALDLGHSRAECTEEGSENTVFLFEVWVGSPVKTPLKNCAQCRAFVVRPGSNWHDVLSATHLIQSVVVTQQQSSIADLCN